MFSELRRTVTGTSVQAAFKLKHRQIIIRCSDGNLIEILDSCGVKELLHRPLSPLCASLLCACNMYFSIITHVNIFDGAKPSDLPAKSVPGQENMVITLAYPRVYTS